MPEQSTAVLMRYIAPLAAFVGAVLMLVFRREMQIGRVLVAVIAGPLFAGLLVPTIDGFIRVNYPWLPGDYSVQGAIGCLIGMLALRIVSMVDKVGDRAEAIVPGKITQDREKTNA